MLIVGLCGSIDPRAIEILQHEFEITGAWAEVWQGYDDVGPRRESGELHRSTTVDPGLSARHIQHRMISMAATGSDR